MTTFITKLTRNGWRKLAVAALGVLVLGPAAQAKDKDNSCFCVMPAILFPGYWRF